MRDVLKININIKLSQIIIYNICYKITCWHNDDFIQHLSLLSRGHIKIEVRSIIEVRFA